MSNARKVDKETAVQVHNATANAENGDSGADAFVNDDADKVNNNIAVTRDVKESLVQNKAANLP